ncbi:MAG: hypothetical protein J6U62_03135, partial [Bacteroidaceae bacterium]|nr:hypothetical protein [Bacteroidaceae bacterium]
MKTRRVYVLLLSLIAGITATMANGPEKSDIFSKSFSKGTPVHISNSRDKAFAIKAGEAGEDVKSGPAAYTADEIWYLVGDAEGFRMYNHSLGKKYALKLVGNGSGDAATIASEKEATLLAITAQPDGSYSISPKEARQMSFNMFGGAGRDIKLYSSNDDGGHWNIKTIDMNRALEIKYNADTEGALATNYKVGELSITINGQRGAIIIDSNNMPESSTCYLPAEAKVGISCDKAYHGWKMTVNGEKALAEQILPEKGLKVRIDITADKENRYQYLYYSPDSKGIPYRIPALATTANGYVFAINDYRPCGNDIGFG